MVTETNFNVLVNDCSQCASWHLIEGVGSQMKPAAWLKMLYDENNGCFDPDAHFILDGVLHEFHMVDPKASLDGYFCENYQSSLSCYQELTSILE